MASSLIGKFEYLSNENAEEFYKQLHVPEEYINKLIPKSGTKKEIIVDGNKIKIKGSTSVTFVLGTEIEETDENDYSFKSTATLEGNILTVHSKSVKHDFVLIRSYQTNEKGLMIILKTDKTDVEAKLYFKKV